MEKIIIIVIIGTNVLPPFTAVSLGTARDGVRGGLFADAHGDEARIDHLVEHVADLDERLGGAGPELLEPEDGFLGRGEGADGVDCEVGGEFVEGRGEGVGSGCHG